MTSLHAINFATVGQTFATNGGSLEALRGVDLSVSRHEFVAVLGPSGCGKSTLLRLASGLMMPTSGTVSVFDKPVTRPRDDIGIVFQQPTLLPWASVLDNVLFPIKHVRGRVGKANRLAARTVLQTVGLADFEMRLPAELSGGDAATRRHCSGVVFEP